MSTRQEAIAAGKTRYHGSPCRLCGSTERHTGNGVCAHCKGVQKEGAPRGFPKSTRQAAIAAGKSRYHGSPCKVCGNTERYTANSVCVQCKCKSVQPERDAAAEVATRRAEARASGQKTYSGFPCKICSGTERYSRNSGCVGCDDERRRAKKQVDPVAKRKMARVVATVRQHIMASALSNYPETNLAIAVFELATMDVFDRAESANAARYLLGDMPGLQLCGIDPDWVRRLLASNEVYNFVVERATRRIGG